MQADRFGDSTGTFDLVPTGTGVKVKDGGLTVGAEGAAVPTPVKGQLLSAATTGGVGYATGAGGVVTQGTSITTGVTLDRPCGTITTFAASAAAGAEDGPFTVTNATVAATDTVVVAIKSYAGTGTPQVYVSAVAAGSFAITITNLNGATALNAAIVINFAVIKGVAA